MWSYGSAQQHGAPDLASVRKGLLVCYTEAPSLPFVFLLAISLSDLCSLFLLLLGVKLDTKLDPRSKERKQTADCLLRKALHGDSRINAISPGDGLTALQLAIKRSWGSFVNSLLAAGE